MSQKRKYENAAEFAKLVTAYFDSISAKEEIMRTVFEGTDADGKKKYRVEAVKNSAGKPLTRVVWYTPPTIGGLCLYLGITRKTLGKYAGRGGVYGKTVERARSIVAAYLEEKISDPDVRNVKGVQLALESLLATLEEESRAIEPKLSTADYQKLLLEAVQNGFIQEEAETDDADEDA